MRAQRIVEAISDAFSSLDEIDLVDESHKHAGRKGTESHFKMLIVASDFEGLNRVQRQRLVYAKLNNEFENGLHALSLRLLTPNEYHDQNSKFESPNCQGQHES